MFVYSLKIAFRNLLRNKVFSFINIFGFAVGIAAVLLITLFVHHELSYDSFHDSPHNIYLVRENVNWSGQWNDISQSVTPLAPALKEDIPEVINSARIMRWFDLTAQYEDKKFTESRVCFADASIFEIFNFPLKYGKAGQALNNPGTVAISETMAEKYFQNTTPLGKTIRIQEEYDLEVAAVFEDLPDNSFINMNLVVSYPTLLGPDFMGQREMQNWRSFNNETFVRLVEGSDAETVNAKLKGLILNRDGEYGWDYHRPYLYPLTQMHLRGDYGKIRILTGVALFILLIASINFMNLSTSQSASRAREIGVCKVLGSDRLMIIRQFLIESMIISLTAMIFALFMVEMVLPWFQNISAKELELSNLGLVSIPVILISTLLIGILSGLYPAFYLSSFQPVKILKGQKRDGKKNSSLRKWLVIVQFTISTVLIIGTISVIRQFNYMQQREIGFEREHLIYLPLESNNFRAEPEVFKQEILNHNSILSATVSSRVFGQISGGVWGVSKPGMQESFAMYTVFADDDIIETLNAGYSWINPLLEENMSLKEGFIINQSTVNEMEIDIHDENTLILGGVGEKPILGVLKDFHVHSLYHSTEPVLISSLRLDGNGNPNKYDCRFLIVRIQPGQISSALEHLESVWKKFDPFLSFDYKFMDEAIGQQYRNERRLASILGGFAVVGIVVALMGLLGLSAYDTEKRTKEIGVRRVLGASVFQITSLLVSDFAKPVLISLLIACPAAFLLVRSYLLDFPYRINFSFAIYTVTAIILLVLSITAVTIQTLKAASMNPADTLRDE